ncbi:hypothetical protein KAR91_35290 [Candidatus Pacearchaeota archaeon]|nr:hypothetical protein [Candidatus Pacearchaeota archaeon]
MPENIDRVDLSLVPLDELLEEAKSRCKTFTCGYDFENNPAEYFTLFGGVIWDNAATCMMLSATVTKNIMESEG